MTKSLTSPKGLALFPSLVTPYTSKEYGGQSYTTQLQLDPSLPEVKQFLGVLKKQSQLAFDEAIAELKKKGGKQAAKAGGYQIHYPFEKDYDKEGNETGFYNVKFKSVYQYKDKNGNTQTKKLPFFDARNNLIKPSNVAYGSLLKISFNYSAPWTNPSNEKAGVTLYINAVQVLVLKESNVRTADDYGFTTDEDYEPIELAEPESDAEDQPKDEDKPDVSFESVFEESEPEQETTEETVDVDILMDDHDF